MSTPEIAVVLKRFDAPDEIRQMPKGRFEVVHLGGMTIGRATFKPGWRWQTSVQPLTGTTSCEAPHFQYHVSGKLGIKMDDGSEFIAGPGDVTALPSGHDAWVVGNEPVVVIDWFGASNYGKQSH